MPSRRSFLKGGLTATALAPLLARIAPAAEPTPVIEASARELTLFAFDDHSIPWRDNLKLTLVPADKHPGNPILRCGPEGSPDYGHAILYGSVLHVGGKFRMWYLGMTQRKIEKGQAPGWWRPMCYAESDDGIHWTKPELGLVEFNGSTKNNICLIESDQFSLSRVNDFLSVMHDPREPDLSRRFKVAYIAHVPFEEVRGGRSKIGPDEHRWCGFIGATSADGLRWKVVGDRPMNAGGERFEVSGLYRFNGTYYATGQLLSPWASLPDGRACGRVMLAYQSSDFDHWSRAKDLAFARPGQLLAEPLQGQQTHMGAGLWNRGNVMLGLYGQWQDGPAEKPKGSTHLWGTRIDLGFIVSNDGVHFREPVPDFKVIARGGAGAWDNICLLQGHAFANVGEQTYIWYSHWDCEGEFRSQEIGLATLRRDGFGYLSPRVKDAPAQCVTKTFAVPHDAQLFVNVDGVSADAPLLLELLHANGQPIPDFSARITASGVRQAIPWSKELPQSFAVRISFPATGEARLYALYAGAPA
ncbi:MAG: hypothetical protein ABJF10_12760 [Chthoniobacter sp.]|uniref:hypothetical protein n=1 Tax=Chthoniobacter sp. TaxID=2510640 RepID=UPI0032A719B8